MPSTSFSPEEISRALVRLSRPAVFSDLSHKFHDVDWASNDEFKTHLQSAPFEEYIDLVKDLSKSEKSKSSHAATSRQRKSKGTDGSNVDKAAAKQSFQASDLKEQGLSFKDVYGHMKNGKPKSKDVTIGTTAAAPVKVTVPLSKGQTGHQDSGYEGSESASARQSPAERRNTQLTPEQLAKIERAASRKRKRRSSAKVHPEGETEEQDENKGMSDIHNTTDGVSAKEEQTASRPAKKVKVDVEAPKVSKEDKVDTEPSESALKEQAKAESSRKAKKNKKKQDKKARRSSSEKSELDVDKDAPRGIEASSAVGKPLRNVQAIEQEVKSKKLRKKEKKQKNKEAVGVPVGVGDSEDSRENNHKSVKTEVGQKQQTSENQDPSVQPKKLSRKQRQKRKSQSLVEDAPVDESSAKLPEVKDTEATLQDTSADGRSEAEADDSISEDMPSATLSKARTALPAIPVKHWVKDAVPDVSERAVSPTAEPSEPSSPAPALTDEPTMATTEPQDIAMGEASDADEAPVEVSAASPSREASVEDDKPTEEATVPTSPSNVGEATTNRIQDQAMNEASDASESETDDEVDNAPEEVPVETIASAERPAQQITPRKTPMQSSEKVVHRASESPRSPSDDGSEEFHTAVQNTPQNPVVGRQNGLASQYSTPSAVNRALSGKAQPPKPRYSFSPALTHLARHTPPGALKPLVPRMSFAAAASPQAQGGAKSKALSVPAYNDSVDAQASFKNFKAFVGDNTSDSDDESSSSSSDESEAETPRPQQTKTVHPPSKDQAMQDVQPEEVSTIEAPEPEEVKVNGQSEEPEASQKDRNDTETGALVEEAAQADEGEGISSFESFHNSISSSTQESHRPSPEVAEVSENIEVPPTEPSEDLPEQAALHLAQQVEDADMDSSMPIQYPDLPQEAPQEDSESTPLSNAEDEKPQTGIQYPSSQRDSISVGPDHVGENAVLPESEPIELNEHQLENSPIVSASHESISPIAEIENNVQPVHAEQSVASSLLHHEGNIEPAITQLRSRTITATPRVVNIILSDSSRSEYERFPTPTDSSAAADDPSSTPRNEAPPIADSIPSSPLADPGRSPSPVHWDINTETAEADQHTSPDVTPRKRKTTGTRSAHFSNPSPAKKPKSAAGTSRVVFPPISAPRFGLIQEELWSDPFRLLVAVTFLNKTAGKTAIPTYRASMERYPTPEASEGANEMEVAEMIHHLGFQNQRARKSIRLAKTWVNEPPVKGMRYRTLHYPHKNDGKGIKPGTVLDEDAQDVVGASEIGNSYGCGPYAWDSWRIFCRDVCRGVAEGYNGEGAKEKKFEPEWKRVIPSDKELRAFSRWMWLREGWEWDPLTGEKKVASVELMRDVAAGRAGWDENLDENKEAEEAKSSKEVAKELEAPKGPETSVPGGNAEYTPAPTKTAEQPSASSPPATSRPSTRKARFSAHPPSTPARTPAERNTRQRSQRRKSVVASSPTVLPQMQIQGSDIPSSHVPESDSPQSDTEPAVPYHAGGEDDEDDGVVDEMEIDPVTVSYESVRRLSSQYRYSDVHEIEESEVEDNGRQDQGHDETSSTSEMSEDGEAVGVVQYPSLREPSMEL